VADLDLMLRKAIDREVSAGIADALKTLSIVASPDGKLQAIVLGTKHEIKGAALPREPSPEPKSPLALVRLSELSRELGVGPWTVRKWVKAGKFPAPLFINDKGAARWRVRDVDAWLEKQKRKRRRAPAPQGALKSLLRKRLNESKS
jgi:predicted DNA-binding transcriptional regulator AlpA